MSSYLLCSSTSLGHVAPMTSIGAHLITAGHRVRMITGSRHRDRVRAAGIEHLPLSGLSDIDHDNVTGDIEGVEDLKGSEIAESQPLETISQGLADAVDRRRRVG
jgi:UDP:flavonoid glycosyltransferase YjiC (YdhE family)